MTLSMLKGFQWAALPVVLLLLAVTIRGWYRGGGAQRDRIFWIMLWIVAGIAIAWPEGTALLARALGIGRGTDLVLYCAVLTMLVGFLMVYARLQKLNREITLLTRHLALQEAETPKP